MPALRDKIKTSRRRSERNDVIRQKIGVIRSPDIPGDDPVQIASVAASEVVNHLEMPGNRNLPDFAAGDNAGANRLGSEGRTASASWPLSAASLKSR